MFLLLALIYLIFISLGLPDSLFGAAWPVMHIDFNIDESFASIYMIITAVGSGGVSFIAGPLIRKFGTGRVSLYSILLTAAGMLIIGFAPHIAVAIVGSILMGLGAGAIDTALNNFVSNHYKAIHMNFLHAFWGIGVTLSPLIMSFFLDNGNNWSGGYKCVAAIQFGIFLLALFSIPLWKKYDKKPENIEGLNEKPKEKIAFLTIIKTKGVLLAVLALGLYVSMEFLLGTWGATYAVNEKDVSPAVAARWISLYYGGIMIGRILSGLLSIKLNDKSLIRFGTIVMIIGMIIFALPIGEKALIGLLIIGIGFGPIFPSTLHAVHIRFGEKYSADITGIQMGGSYAIGWAIQLTYGYLAPATTFSFTPYLLIGLAILMFITTELVNKKTSKNMASLS